MTEGFKLDKFIAGGVILAIFYAARSVVTPLLAAFLAAFLMEPLVAGFARKTGRPVAVILTLLILTVGFSIVMIFLIPQAIQESIEAAQAVQQNIGTLNATLQKWLNALPEEIKNQAAESMSAYGGKILAWGAGALVTGLGFLGGIANAIAKIILFLVGFVFLMIDFHLLKPGLLNLLAHVRWAPPQIRKVDAYLSESESIFRAFFRGQLLYAAAIGILTAIGLCAIRLPYGLTIGIAVGLLSLVPYAGIALGLILALAVSFHSHGQILHLVLTAGVFGLVQFIDAVYLTPKFLGGSVGIHPLLAVVALLAFSQLFGFFGLMLAIPLAAVTLAALRLLLTEPDRAI